jgi:transposase
MATNTIPDELLELIISELPPLPISSPLGGRPPVEHHVVLRVIWHVLVTGCRWCDVQKEFGCCGETAQTRVRDWQKLGIWNKVHQRLLNMLNKADKLETSVAVVDSTQTRAFGAGELTGPNPQGKRALCVVWGSAGVCSLVQLCFLRFRQDVF